MTGIQLKNILRVIAPIIVAIVSGWLLMSNAQFFLSILQIDDSETIKTIDASPESVSYTEKIDNFAMQEFNEIQKLIHYIEAQTYLNYKNHPARLLSPKVTTYKDNGEPDYILNSDSADYLDSGDIKFIGSVTLKPYTGIGHNIETEELIASSNDNNIFSNKRVNYYGDEARIVAKGGLEMNTKESKANLKGDTEIFMDRGRKINTKNLVVDRSEGHEHYYSEYATRYLTDANKISSEGMDLDMKKNILNLYGTSTLENPDVTINTKNLVVDQSNDQERYYSKYDTSYITENNTVHSEAIDLNMKTKVSYLSGNVTILQSSGNKVETIDLVVDQSDGKEVYKTNSKIHYKSNSADINATGMYYDAVNQLMNLTGGVVGRYE
jgi:LPS export ABC transporter protein LptC